MASSASKNSRKRMSGTRRRTASAALILLLCVPAVPCTTGAAGAAQPASPFAGAGTIAGLPFIQAAAFSPPVGAEQSAAKSLPAAGTSSAASPVAGAESSPPPGNPVPAGARLLSTQEVLFLAKTLLEQGRIEEAEKVYDSLRNHPSEDIRIESLFQISQIRLHQGKFRQASNLLMEILNRRPDLPRVRLELARAYFLDKNYSDAAFQFELVKGGKLPPEVLAKVDGFLDAIRRQKNWTLDFSLSPVTDSNINQASGGRQECIDTAFGLLCRPLQEKASGYGLSGNATGEYFWRFHQDWGIRATLGAYGVQYEQHDYDDVMLYGALGPRYLWESGEASVQGTFRKRWIADKEYYEQRGLRVDARQIYRRLIMDAGASYAVTDYDNSYVNRFLQGPTWEVRLQPRLILTDRSFVQIGGAFIREDTKNRAWANDSWRYALGGYYAFPYGFALFVEGSVMESRYKASQWYITRDYRIDETIRRDITKQLSASLSSSLFESWGLTPILQYVYTKRESNIWTREFERHRLNLLVNYRF